MILTVRTTTGRENVVMESLATKIKAGAIPINAMFRPEEIRGYIFVEGELNDIESATKNVPHVRGIIPKEIPMSQIERFLVAERQEIKVGVGDVIEIVGGPFKGERGKVTRIDETKQEVTVEFLEAAIPIPVTVPVNSVSIHSKKKEE
ncbi:MAG: transcription elongation factor Spt5 [Candidatus Aenigmarchaeota archaeon]|nr:transcription elongation factor Spt5 [Candidatus Aenigmarchaeota archaeon]